MQKTGDCDRRNWGMPGLHGIAELETLAEQTLQNEAAAIEDEGWTSRNVNDR